MMKWADVAAAEGYEISEFGDVRNKKTGKIYKQSLDSSGYWKTQVSVSGKPIDLQIHRQILLAFEPAGEYGALFGAKMDACHQDGNKDNNCLQNLRWDLHASNIQDKRLSKHGKGIDPAGMGGLL